MKKLAVLLTLFVFILYSCDDSSESKDTTTETDDDTTETAGGFGTYSAVAATNAPQARNRGLTYWTGDEVLVWGGDGANGSINSGKKYDPVDDSWADMADAPHANGRTDLYHCKQGFTGRYMVYWGGREVTGGSYYGGGSSDAQHTGAIYDNDNDTWTELTAIGDQSWGGRAYVACGWDDSNQFYFYGGADGYEDTAGSGSTAEGADTTFQSLNANTFNNNSDDTWTDLSSANSPVLSQRKHATVHWSGSELLVWGGMFDDTTFYADGAVYDPSGPAWTAMADSPLDGRRFAAHTWTGTKLIVWGGMQDGSGGATFYKDGAVYDPALNTWTAMSEDGAPSERGYLANAVWTGSHMFIFGGLTVDSSFSFSFKNNGGLYDPETNTWTTVTNADGLPRGGIGGAHIAYLGEGKILIWGGQSGQTEYSDTGVLLELSEDYYQD